MGYHSYSFILSTFKVVRYYNDSWFDSQFSLGHQNLFVIFSLNVVRVIRISFFNIPSQYSLGYQNCLYIASQFSLSNAIFPIIAMNFVGLIWLNPIKDHWQFNIIAIVSQDFPTLWTLNVIFLYIHSIRLNSPYAQVYRPTWVELVYSLRKLQQCNGDVIKVRHSIRILSASGIPPFLLCAHRIIK